jgi:two-component sensor histidine kinase
MARPRIRAAARQMVVFAGLASCAASANGADVGGASEPAQLPGVTVVGSRLPTAEAQTAQDVHVYQLERIEQSGQSTVADFLATLPEVSLLSPENTTGFQTIRLRGAIFGAVLVLINGHRTEPVTGGAAPFGFFDIRTIPLSLVERIEILATGSSAIYGGDAIGGVVNIVLRSNFTGAEVGSGYSWAKDTHMWLGWVGGGWKVGDFNLSIMGSYSQSTALSGKDRDITANPDMRRFGERTRIARELHDTLLQSFHGLLLRFQTVMDLLPNRASEAKQLLASTIDQAADAITEGRDAVQGLRASTTETNDLAVALRTLGDQLAAEQSTGPLPALRVEVQGAPRVLHPIVRDEVFRIGGEALSNAYRHAQAQQIEVELRYDGRELRLRVRDDGMGIDPRVLREGGREGHFGLPGMRERAQLIGGKLVAWSAHDAGTEIELSIPAAHAYAASTSPRRTRFAEKLYRQGTTSDS